MPASLPAALREVLPDLARRLRRAVPDQLGLILSGSVGLGGFSPRFSDLDLILVLPRALPPSQLVAWQDRVETALAGLGAWRSRLDLILLPLPALLARFERAIFGLRLQRGRWQPTRGYPLDALETQLLHQHGRTLVGRALIPLFPPEHPHAPIDHLLDLLATIRSVACWQDAPFQPFRAGGRGHDRALAAWSHRLARAVWLLTHARPASPPDTFRHLAAVGGGGDEARAWWLALAEAWSEPRRPLPPLTTFPLRYLQWLKHLLSLTGRGRPALAALTPIPDPSGFIPWRPVHARLARKLDLDYLLTQWRPGQGLRPRHPAPRQGPGPQDPGLEGFRPTGSEPENPGSASGRAGLRPPRKDRWPW